MQAKTGPSLQEVCLTSYHARNMRHHADMDDAACDVHLRLNAKLQRGSKAMGWELALACSLA